MSYQDFLTARRKLMAEVTREGFRKLSDPNHLPKPAVKPVLSASEPESLLFDEPVQLGRSPLEPTSPRPTEKRTSLAEVTENGTILLEEIEYRTPDLAARADGADDVDGWDYWSAAFDEPVLLSELRAR